MVQLNCYFDFGGIRLLIATEAVRAFLPVIAKVANVTEICGFYME